MRSWPGNGTHRVLYWVYTDPEIYARELRKVFGGLVAVDRLADRVVHGDRAAVGGTINPGGRHQRVGVSVEHRNGRTIGGVDAVGDRVHRIAVHAARDRDRGRHGHSCPAGCARRVDEGVRAQQLPPGTDVGGRGPIAQQRSDVRAGSQPA